MVLVFMAIDAAFAGRAAIPIHHTPQEEPVTKAQRRSAAMKRLNDAEDARNAARDAYYQALNAGGRVPKQLGRDWDAAADALVEAREAVEAIDG